MRFIHSSVISESSERRAVSVEWWALKPDCIDGRRDTALVRRWPCLGLWSLKILLFLLYPNLVLIWNLITYYCISFWGAIKNLCSDVLYVVELASQHVCYLHEKQELVISCSFFTRSLEMQTPAKNTNPEDGKDNIQRSVMIWMSVITVIEFEALRWIGPPSFYLTLYHLGFGMVWYSSIYIAPRNSRGPMEALLVRLAPIKETSFKKW